MPFGYIHLLLSPMKRMEICTAQHLYLLSTIYRPNVHRILSVLCFQLLIPRSLHQADFEFKPNGIWLPFVCEDFGTSCNFVFSRKFVGHCFEFAVESNREKNILSRSISPLFSFRCSFEIVALSFLERKN